MKLARLYIGVKYENDKKIGFSYIAEELNGEIHSTDHRVIKRQSLENIIAGILKKILGKQEESDISHIGIYADNELVVKYVQRLIEDRHYDNIVRLKYQPRGTIFKKLRDNGVKLILSTTPKSEIFDIVNNNAIYILKEWRDANER